MIYQEIKQLLHLNIFILNLFNQIKKFNVKVNVWLGKTTLRITFKTIVFTQKLEIAGKKKIFIVKKVSIARTLF